jgi:hypothetical protein
LQGLFIAQGLESFRATTKVLPFPFANNIEVSIMDAHKAKNYEILICGRCDPIKVLCVKIKYIQPLPIA